MFNLYFAMVVLILSLVAERLPASDIPVLRECFDDTAKFAFSHPGEYCTAPVNLIIVDECHTNAVIRYTLDGRQPVESDPIVSTEVPILLDGGPVTVTARAWIPQPEGGLLPSINVETLTYYFFLAGVEFDPPSGALDNGTLLKIISETPGARVSYWAIPVDPVAPWGDVDWDALRATVFGIGPPGQPPSTGALEHYLATGFFSSNPNWLPYETPIVFETNVMLFAKAEKEGYSGLRWMYGLYQLPRVPQVEFNPKSGEISETTLVTINSVAPGVSVRYTLDGGDPTPESAEYGEPIPIGPNTQLKSRAFKAGHNPSFVRYGFYKSVSTPILASNRLNSAEWPSVNLSLTARSDRPVCITHAGDGTQRLFIVEEPGRIRIIGNQNSFLDIMDRVRQGIRVGMIGAAFPRNFDYDGHFYVSYIGASDGRITISRFQAVADASHADPDSEEVILKIPDSSAAHRGQIAFGPDGYLYIAVADPNGDAQTSDRLAGKLLRIDVEGGQAPYAIPQSNPFVADPSYRPEIWALGLRDTLGFSFDRLKGDLVVPDRSLNLDEINLEPVGSLGGANYGWNIVEGPDSSHEMFTSPVAVHSRGFAIVGGRVWRGAGEPRLGALYLYGQSSGQIWGRELSKPGLPPRMLTHPALANPLDPFGTRPFTITAFGEDESGRLYVADYGASIPVQDPPHYEIITGGGIYRIDDDLLNFALHTERLDGGKLRLWWQSEVNHEYQLEVSADLDAWTNQGEAVSGTGGILSFNQLDKDGESPQFFRVKVRAQEN